jgi:hypothetical protein
MTAVSVWRARGYWALATVLLPLVNPVLYWYALFLGDSDGFEGLPVLFLLALGNAALLRMIAGRLWRKPEMRRWRVALGVGLALALSVVYGIGELYALLVITCPESGCFN